MDGTSQALINVMLACTSGEVYLCLVKTISEQKEASYVSNCMIDYIVAVGAETIVQICIDNTVNIIAARDLLVG